MQAELAFSRAHGGAALSCARAPRYHPTNGTRTQIGNARGCSAEPAPEPVLSASDTVADLAALLGHCARGDRSAFRQIYDLHAARLYALALRVTRQPALASDAVHDAFIQVWQHADRFDPERGSAEAWLTSLVRYRALDITRRRQREVTGLDLPEQEDEDPNALARMVGASEVAALRACLEALDGEKRRLVTMAFIQGLTHTQLSERLSMPVGTVKSSIRRGLASLKKCLDQ